MQALEPVCNLFKARLVPRWKVEAQSLNRKKLGSLGCKSNCTTLGWKSHEHVEIPNHDLSDLELLFGG
jgi:hypothetical protein